MEVITANTLRLPELFAYRAQARREMATDFCDLPEFVFGCEVRPVTPRTWSMLTASGNAFAVGGQVTVGDVVDFIWFHSPRYVLPQHWAHWWRKRRALWLLRRELRTGIPERQSAVLVLATADIRRLLTAAFRAASSGKPGPVLATLEAQLCDEFARAYGWTPERTRDTPLARLFQLDRCLAVSRGAEIRDDGEDEILAAHLKRRFAAMKKQPTEASR